MPSREALAGIPSINAAMSGDTVSPSHEGLIGGTKVPSGASVSMTLSTLSPSGGAALSPGSEGEYIGDGLPPVPAKVAAKIRKGEFIEMGELLPEFMASQREDDLEGKQELKVRRSRKVTDILTWVKCFGKYASVRARHAPHLFSELMAYMGAIVTASQDYAGLAWVRYDAAYRRQAAITGNTRWSMINPTLYTICFTGRATSMPRCELCFATTHSAKDCAQQGDPDPGMQDRLKAIETAVLALTSKPPVPSMSMPRTTPARPSSNEPCRKWNSNNCTYPRCRYNHVCSGCGGSHPVVRCPARPISSGQATYPGSSPLSGKHFPPAAKPY